LGSTTRLLAGRLSGPFFGKEIESRVWMYLVYCQGFLLATNNRPGKKIFPSGWLLRGRESPCNLDSFQTIPHFQTNETGKTFSGKQTLPPGKRWRSGAEHSRGRAGNDRSQALGGLASAGFVRALWFNQGQKAHLFFPAACCFFSSSMYRFICSCCWWRICCWSLCCASICALTWASICFCCVWAFLASCCACSCICF